MGKYILRRVLLMIPIMLGVSFLVYTIMSVTPGFQNPGRIVLGIDATDEAVRQLNTQLGADKPFFPRYFSYMWGVLHGDFGISYRTRLNVSAEIIRRFPITMTLAAISVLFSMFVGVPIGIWSAIRQYKPSDYIIRVISMLLTAIPSFCLGLGFLLIFALKLRILPANGIKTWKGFIMPGLSLALVSVGSMIRMTRSTMLEVIRQDYVRTARAKGQTEQKIVVRHELRNAMIPIVTVAGLNFGRELGGATIIENVFAVPGLGTYILSGVNNRDLPCILGAVILLSLTFSMINLLVDILYSFIDPRIKTQISG
ncbi:MAG: ABC transporter permease [Flexilinea sp.]|nr:ABC transporter permease [Flexilinea sp.]